MSNDDLKLKYAGDIAEEDVKDSKNVSELEEDNEFRRIGNYIFAKVKKLRYLIALDIAVFLLLFFLIPQIIFTVKPYIWMSLFAVFTIVPTFAFYSKKTFRSHQILYGLLIYYLLISMVINYCTINELYGISNRGSLDPTPAWLDSVFVTFIIVFFQYIGVALVKLMPKKKKELKKEVKED